MYSGKIKKIPYSRTSFEQIIREGFYYVDKTRFIRMLEDDGGYIIFLRPRRYGKSLTIAMLDAYYNIKFADQFDELFGGLDIGADPTPLHNTYLVLSLNFSAVDSSKDKVEQSFNDVLLQHFRDFAYCYRDILPNGTEDTLNVHTNSNTAFNYLCGQVARTDKKMYVLIDEYDNFANTLMSYDENAYCNLTHGDGFFRLFFNSLKAATTGNSTPIDRMYISGVSPLTLSDVTSGFNIGSNFSLLPDYNEMVGFTEQEVRDILQYYHDATGKFRHSVDELLEIMRPWYDNNCFNKYSIEEEHMYNSDMVLYFIDKYIKLRCHVPEQMIDSNVHSDYGKMRKMISLDESFGEKAQTFQKVINDGYIDVPLQAEFSISELHKPVNLPSLMFYMGLLTYGKTPDDDTALVVPNLVAREQCYKYLNECYDQNLNWRMELEQYVDLSKKMAKKGEGEPLLRYVAEQIRENSSTRDFDSKAESFVKGFMLAKLGSMVPYFISQTEPDMNHGYADLYLEPWTETTNHAYVIELKYCPVNNKDAKDTKNNKDAKDTDNVDEATLVADSDVERQLKAAIDQANKYVADKHLLQRASARGWTLHKFAIVFKGWKLAVCEEIC